MGVFVDIESQASRFLSLPSIIIFSGREEKCDLTFEFAALSLLLYLFEHFTDRTAIMRLMHFCEFNSNEHFMIAAAYLLYRCQCFLKSVWRFVETTCNFLISYANQNILSVRLVFRHISQELKRFSGKPTGRQRRSNSTRPWKRLHSYTFLVCGLSQFEPRV